MHSGTRGFRIGSIGFAYILVILSASLLWAQKPADNKSAASSPTVRTPAEAATSLNGETSGSSRSGSSQEPGETPKTTAAPPGMIALGPGDLIEVNVYNVPELTTKARVSKSGDVYLPLIDYVHVVGLTQEEAQALIEKRLSDGGFVRSPHVTIFVDEAMSQGVTLMGEVGRPGIYSDTPDHKLYQVISQAGGFTTYASRKIAIVRKGQNEAIRITLPRNLTDDLSGDVDVWPGDTINVPRAPIVYVVGDVARPSGLVVDNGTLTVMQAIALAGGTNHTAKLGGVRLIRKTPSGLTETRVQLKKILEAKIPDVTLQADDILFVPISGMRVLAGKTADVAVAAATTVTIYTAHP